MVAFTYINRRLKFKDNSISEDQALKISNCLVVLAEPGAGKTELLSNFATKLNTTRIRASVFRYKNSQVQQDVIIIDGLDEVAKHDSSAIEQTLSKIVGMLPKLIIFASRSSEWDETRNAGLIRDFLRFETSTVRLDPFDESEQKLLFESYIPNKNFLVS
jgi:predicted NACHT family NTPase